MTTTFFLLLIGACHSDGHVVCRATTISSERSIAVLSLEAAWGIVHEYRAGQGFGLGSDVFGGGRIDGSTLTIDGEQTSGIGGVARTIWRLVGFIFWDASGRIERVTLGKFGGRSVRIVDAFENGRVWVSVTVGPPLGDRRVRCAVLELEATEHAQTTRLGNSTSISVSCQAAIDLPFNCRIVRRIAERKAGPELSARVQTLRRAGEKAVRDGRQQISTIVRKFLEETCDVETAGE